jgi:hypothetical protein
VYLEKKDKDVDYYLWANGKFGDVEIFPRVDKTILGNINDKGNWDNTAELGT